MIKKLFSWILSPYIKIRAMDAIGVDGVSRRKYFYVGLIWEVHKPGYWMLWYDCPIHHFSLLFLQIYWHTDIEANNKDENGKAEA